MAGDEHAATPTESLSAAIARRDGGSALIGVEPLALLSAADLAGMVESLAASLATVGAAPDAPIALSPPNSPEMVVLFFAIVLAGAAAAPLNPAYTEDEYRTYLEDLRPAAMLFLGQGPIAARRACAKLDIRMLEVSGAGAELRIKGVGSASALPEANPDRVALILHTSGTTSRPKGVPLRQRNLMASARAIAATYSLGPADVSYCVMPLFHVHGLVASTLAPLVSGGTVVIPRRLNAASFWNDASAHRATWFSAVPTIHQALVARTPAGQTPPLRPGSTMRFARSCSSALPGELWKEFEERFDLPLVEAYGMTEAAHQMASNPLPPKERRAGSVGTATGTEIAALDDAWLPQPPGQEGEIAVRGPGVVDGYRDNPDANVAFKDGWFRTGDSGLISADGYVSLAGRIKELINRAGEKISPYEVENVLLSHPSVAEAVCYAVPDHRYGEEVGAALVLRESVDTQQLRRHCNERLASFKVPRHIDIVDAIPKGPTGKVQRRLMAELIARS